MLCVTEQTRTVVAPCLVPGCTPKSTRRTKGYCPGHYSRILRYGRPDAPRKLRPIGKGKTIQLLRDWVANRDRGDCWLDWPFATKPTSDKGGRKVLEYPVMGIPGPGHTPVGKAGWVVMELTGRPRPLPPADNMLHSCDASMCLNPDHLRWGTLSDNAQDMWDRDRGPMPRTRR